MKKFISFVFILSFLICSCQSDSNSTEITTDGTNLYAPISIETFSDESTSVVKTDEESEEPTYPTFETHKPEYDIAPCEFDIDIVNHTIKAHYDDTADKPDGCVVDINLLYSDYGVQQVSIIEATRNNSAPVIKISDTEWEEKIYNGFGALYTFSPDEYRGQLSVQGALSFELVSDEEVENMSVILDLLDNEYDVFPVISKYTFPISEMKKYEEPDMDFSFYYLDEENIDYVTVRSIFDGLPVGIPFDNDRIQMRVRYGDYCGSFFNVHDDYETDYKNESTIIDFRYYAYDYEVVSTGEVIPLEQCIDNALPGLITESYTTGGNHCNAYFAELAYVPLRIGMYDMSDLNPNNVIFFVPVWAIYTVSYGEFGTRASEVYLNAITGELVSYAI